MLSVFCCCFSSVIAVYHELVLVCLFVFVLFFFLFFLGGGGTSGTQFQLYQTLSVRCRAQLKFISITEIGIMINIDRYINGPI